MDIQLVGDENWQPHNAMLRTNNQALANCQNRLWGGRKGIASLSLRFSVGFVSPTLMSWKVNAFRPESDQVQRNQGDRNVSWVQA